MAIHKLSNNVREVYPRLSFEYMDVTSAYSSPFSIECYGLLRHHFLCHMVYLIPSYEEQQRLFLFDNLSETHVIRRFSCRTNYTVFFIVTENVDSTPGDFCTYIFFEFFQSSTKKDGVSVTLVGTLK